MLNALRSSGSNTFVWIIIGLLIVGLAGFGIGGSGGGGAETPVANVGEEPVTVRQYVRALNEQNRQLTAQYGTQLSMQDLRAAGIDQIVIQSLLTNAAFDGEAKRIGISIGDETVLRELLRIDSFKGLDGKFDKDRYEMILENADLSPSEYEDVMRDERTRRIIQASVVGGIRVPDTAARQIVSFQAERRALEWVRFSEANLADPIGGADDAALQAHYEANIEDYRTAERRTVEYAYLTEEMVMDSVQVDAAEVRALYDDRVADYSNPARRMVDRIVYPDRAAAETAIAAIRAGEQSFDDAAADRGLGPDAIDLGEVTETDVNKEERALLFAAQEPGILGPVKSDVGPAIYRINAILDASLVTFEEAEAELRGELAQELAAVQIAEASSDIEDLLAGGAMPADLAADTDMVFGTATIEQNSSDGPAADQAFRDEVFAADLGEDRDLIQLSDGIAVVRVVGIAESDIPPLASVKSEVETAWRAAEVERRLIALAQSQQVRVDDGAELGAIAADFGLIVTEEAPLGRSDIIEDTPPQFAREIFAAKDGKAAVVADGETVLLARITEIIAADPDADEVALPIDSVRGDMSRNTAQDLLYYFANGLQEAAGISVNQSLIDNVQSQFIN